MELNHQLPPKVKQLRLSGLLATLAARHRQVIEGPWADGEWLERWRADEGERRAQKPRARRVRRAALKTTKTWEGGAWRFTPTINRQPVLHLASCASIRQKRHVLLCGPTGVGTSHLAPALAHDACRQGGDVRFVNTPKMLQHRHGGRADGTWMKRLSRYLRPELLVLDDLGLKPLVDPAPSDLSEVINDRDEVGRVLVTSHRAPTDRVAGSLWQSTPSLRGLGSAGASCRDPGDHRPQYPGPRAST